MTFGEAGTLVKLTNKETSAVGAVASAVSGAGGQVVEMLDQADKIKLAFPETKDPSLLALEREVARRELEAKLVTADKTISGGGSAAAHP